MQAIVCQDPMPSQDHSKQMRREKIFMMSSVRGSPKNTPSIWTRSLKTHLLSVYSPNKPSTYRLHSPHRKLYLLPKIISQKRSQLQTSPAISDGIIESAPRSVSDEPNPSLGSSGEGEFGKAQAGARFTARSEARAGVIDLLKYHYGIVLLVCVWLCSHI